MDTSTFDEFVENAEKFIGQISDDRAVLSDDVLQVGYQTYRTVKLEKREAQRRLSATQRLENRLDYLLRESEDVGPAPTKIIGADGKRYTIRDGQLVVTE